MALRLEQKKAAVSAIKQAAMDAHSAIAAEYRGLVVSELTKLRAQAREQGICVKVVKNTLAKRALQGTPYECMSAGLIGPLMLMFSQQSPGAAARLLKDFNKDNDLPVVKMIAIDGEFLQPSELTRLANLPDKEQAISMMMAVMRAPIEKFVRVLAQPHTKLVRTIAALRDQKQAAA